MTKKAALVCVSLTLAWLFLLTSAGIALGPTDALVSVVSLDEHGNPVRQGMGILVRKDGSVLTSASIMADCRSGIVKTADGALQVIRKISRWESLQDLALLQIEPGSSKLVAVEPASRLQPPEKVWVGIRQKPAGQLREAKLTKTLPFSPRLTLLKLEPGNLDAEPGSSILNRRGELVGMLHVFAGDRDQSQTCRFYLARQREHFIPKNADKPEELPWPNEPLKRFDSPRIQDFWEGVGSSLRQEWPEAQKKFTAAITQPGILPEAFFGRGVARYNLGDWDGAVKDLEEATRRLPGYALAFIWLGKSRERQGNPAAAARDYEQAATLSPDLSEAWFRLGELAYKAGELVKAKECLERAKGDSAQGAKSWWYLGNIALKENRAQDGLEAFNQAIKLEPEFFQAYLDGGKLLMDGLGQPKEAAVLLKEAVRLKPAQALPRYYLALASLSSWNRTGAWEQYFVLQDMSPELAANLAKALERSR
jgi:tetratricopeptide (TPR) repeat protein